MAEASDPASRYRPLTLSALSSMPAPSWLVDRLVPAGGLVVLFAPPAQGKSLLALDLALSIAAGTESWFGRTISRGSTIYALGEGLRSLGPRTEAWLRLHPGADPESRLLFVPAVPPLHELDEVAAFEDAICSTGTTRADLLVIDTLARARSGLDENDSTAMGLTVKGLDYLREKFHTTVMAVHHQGWTPGRERGSSALRGAVDTTLFLDLKDGRHTLRVLKQRDGAEGPALRLKLVPYGPSVVFLPDEEPDTPDRLTDAQQGALNALQAAPEPLRWKDWLSATQLPKRTFCEAIGELDRRGLVRKAGQCYQAVAPEVRSAD